MEPFTLALREFAFKHRTIVLSAISVFSSASKHVSIFGIHIHAMHRYFGCAQH